MEQTALRPKPMPGQEPGDGTKPGTTRRPHAARRRGRRLITLLFSVFVGTVLVLSGVGLGTVGATVIGMGKLADMQRQAARQPARTATPGTPADRSASAASPMSPPASPTSATSAGATLGVEAADAETAGALIVGVHMPGPGYTAGLVRGDVLLTFGGARVDSAADLAHAVTRAHPGKEVTVTVRHRSGGFQQFTVVPGFVV